MEHMIQAGKTSSFDKKISSKKGSGRNLAT